MKLFNRPSRSDDKPLNIDHSNTESQSTRHKHPPKEGWGSVFTTVIIFGSATLVALLLTLFVFQQYEVDGPSMESTLQNQDRLVVVKVERTWAKITGHAYIPNRGDVVIFNEGGLYSASGVAEKQLVKRVIGLPGERVVVKNGVLTIYNRQYPNGFQPDKTMAYGKVITTTPGDLDITIPSGDIFVCGDNRPDSLDSRYFGPIPASSIVGKLDLRIYPFNKINVF